MKDIIFKKITNEETIAMVSLSDDMVLFDTKVNRYSNALLDLGFHHHNTEITDAGDNTSIYTFTFIKNNTQC